MQFQKIDNSKLLRKPFIFRRLYENFVIGLLKIIKSRSCRTGTEGVGGTPGCVVGAQNKFLECSFLNISAYLILGVSIFSNSLPLVYLQRCFSCTPRESCNLFTMSHLRRQPCSFRQCFQLKAYGDSLNHLFDLCEPLLSKSQGFMSTVYIALGAIYK